MNRSVAALTAITLLALGCAKDKGNPQPSSPADALSSNAANQCAQLGTCQPAPNHKTPPPATSATSTDTNIVTDTSTGSSTATDTTTQTEPPVTPPPPPPVTPPPPPPIDPGQDRADLNDTQRLAKNAVLTCKRGDCDPSVGLLSLTVRDEKNVWNAAQCTASLVAPDVIATNAHCVPNDLAAAGSSCRNRLWLTFAKDNAHPEYDSQLGCDKVLFRYKDGGMDGADYAYLKLARPSNRPTLRINQAGFENSKTFHIHKINPGRMQGGTMGMLEKVDCRSMYESALFSAPLDAQSRTMLLVDCEVIPGNSGSPVFADDGSLRGVLYAFVRNELVRPGFDKNGSSVPSLQDLGHLNTIANFACLNMPGDPDGRAVPASCGDPLAKLAVKRAAYNHSRVQVLRPAAQKQIAANAKSHDDILAFGWSLSLTDTDATGLIGIGVPECVNAGPAARFLGQQSKIYRPLFSIRADYDKYFRASNLRPIWGGFEKTGEDLQLSQSEDRAYRLNIENPDTGQAEFNARLGNCSK